MFIIKLSLLTCSFPPRILPNVTRNPIHHQFSLIISVLADALSSHRAPQWKQLRLFRQSFCPQYCGPEHFLEQLRLRLRFFQDPEPDPDLSVQVQFISKIQGITNMRNTVRARAGADPNVLFRLCSGQLHDSATLLQQCVTKVCSTDIYIYSSSIKDCLGRSGALTISSCLWPAGWMQTFNCFSQENIAWQEFFAQFTLPSTLLGLQQNSKIYWAPY